jgi:hypothetical protein
VRTPTIHFDYFQKHVPYGREGWGMTRDSHRNITTEDLLDGVISNFLADMDGTSRTMGFQMMLYHRLGEHTYVVGPKVQDLFRRTDLSRITHDMLVPPARCFYVALADCPWRIWGGDRTRWHQVTGCYVSFTLGYSSMSGGGKANGINFCIWGRPNERSENNADDAVLWHSINLDVWRETDDDLETFFESSRVMRATAERPGEWTGTSDPLDPTSSGAVLPADAAGLEEQREMLRSVMRTALNVCLYTSSEDPDIETVDNSANVRELQRQLDRAKSKGKIKKLRRRITNAPRTRIVYIGPMFETPPPASNGGPGGGGAHATPIEHTVKPHYQRYWVGSGDSKRRVWKYRVMHTRGSGKPDRTIVKIRE